MTNNFPWKLNFYRSFIHTKSWEALQTEGSFQGLELPLRFNVEENRYKTQIFLFINHNNKYFKDKEFFNIYINNPYKVLVSVVEVRFSDLHLESQVILIFTRT